MGPHWSSRFLAAELGVSHATVARVWAEHQVKPWRTETFKFSTDPELEGKIRDVVGLYLNSPEHATVLYVDGKSQIQALEPTQPSRPVGLGPDGRQEPPQNEDPGAAQVASERGSPGGRQQPLAAVTASRREAPGRPDRHAAVAGGRSRDRFGIVMGNGLAARP